MVNSESTVSERPGYNGWRWDLANTPRYGDVAAIRDSRSDYINVWGSAPTSVTDYTGSQYVYMSRVIAADAFDLSKYEYWWGLGEGWKSDVLTTFTSDTAVF
jgi:hypothetical protein